MLLLAAAVEAAEGVRMRTRWDRCVCCGGSHQEPCPRPAATSLGLGIFRGCIHGLARDSMPLLAVGHATP